MEAVLAYFRAEHPDTALDALCSGPELVSARYSIPAARLHWYSPERQIASGRRAIARRYVGLGLGLIIDTYRTAAWVRRHDAVVVPGMGVLEVTVPLRPWQTPYSMFLLAASGRLFGTKVALVSVGTNVINQRLSRWLVTAAARLAYYRSFRDTVSKDAMQDMGLDTSADTVYPDVVFSLPTPQDQQGAANRVGIGVMDYSGGNDDRREGDEIRSAYIEKMTRFALWLMDSGRPIRLFTSDTADEPVVRQILSVLRAQRPGLDPSLVVAEPAPALEELLRQTATVGTVIACRYHNVLYALKMARPTISLGYAAKHDALMAEMGMSEFSRPVRSLDVTRLIEQFGELESRSAQLRHTLTARIAEKARLVDGQFAQLSAALFPAAETSRAAGRSKASRIGVP